jgi:Na+/H+ antiporter NhaC
MLVAATNAHPYGWWSLTPPIVAILLAILTRRVITSLLAGIAVGALITTGGHPLTALEAMLETHLWHALTDPDRTRVFAFTLLMGAMVGVISEAGGMRGLVRLGQRWASTRRRGQLATWGLGLLIFFDDYANTVLLGNTMRPLADRLGISREKLAYLVDSTAAPVAGLALVSTWVAGEIGYVQDGLDQLATPPAAGAFGLFVASIPYRFYVLWALLFVFLVGLTGRDFGPMLRAERRARRRPATDTAVDRQAAKDSPDTARWYNAVVPIVITVLAVLGLLYRTGRAAGPDAPPTLWVIIGNADSYYALVWGSLAGLAAAVLLVRIQRLLTAPQVLQAAQRGASLMLPSLAVLWLASALSAMTGNKTLQGESAAPYALRYRLYSGEYCSQLLTSRQELASSLSVTAPTVVFVLSAFVSFATGTSWGTMAIVMPMAIPMVGGLLTPASGVPPPAEHPLLLSTIGSVLAGAIFGDHCSPISDTTILSSQSSGCDHLAHVWTQMPYALLVGVVSLVCGTLPAGLGCPLWCSHVAGVVALVLALRLAGRKVASGAPGPTAGSDR